MAGVDSLLHATRHDSLALRWLREAVRAGMPTTITLPIALPCAIVSTTACAFRVRHPHMPWEVLTTTSSLDTSSDGTCTGGDGSDDVRGSGSRAVPRCGPGASSSGGRWRTISPRMLGTDCWNGTSTGGTSTVGTCTGGATVGAADVLLLVGNRRRRPHPRHRRNLRAAGPKSDPTRTPRRPPPPAAEAGSHPRRVFF